MTTILEHRIADHLAHLRPALLTQVTEHLATNLPMIGIDQTLVGAYVTHYQQMQATAERFHELVLLAAELDWLLVVFEYTWTARVLQPMGVTWEHQALLIKTYFAVARHLANWSAEELAVLDNLAERLWEEGARAYKVSGARFQVSGRTDQNALHGLNL